MGNKLGINEALHHLRDALCCSIHVSFPCLCEAVLKTRGKYTPMHMSYGHIHNCAPHQAAQCTPTGSSPTGQSCFGRQLSTRTRPHSLHPQGGPPQARAALAGSCRLAPDRAVCTHRVFPDRAELLWQARNTCIQPSCDMEGHEGHGASAGQQRA